MVKSKHIHNLFNASGCLTLETINRYHSGRLSNADMEEVRNHMEECDLCRDAVEGYKNLADKKRQHELMITLQKKIRSRYTPKPVKVKYGRERRLNPTLTLISAAATVLIILGIYGIVSTDIFRNESLLVEQIQEKESKSEDRITRVEEPILETAPEAHPEPSQQPDSFKYIADYQEPEVQEQVAVITGVSELEPEAISEVDAHLARTMEETILDVPRDTIVIEKMKNVAGVEVETVAIEGKSTAKKTAALPVNIVSVDMDVAGKMEEDTGAISTGGFSYYTVVDEMPRFSVTGYQDFNDYIRMNLKYPENAKKPGITGEVLIQFIVNKYGKVEDVRAIQAVDSLLDKEAVRVVKASPKWIPGMQNGEKVNVQLVYPVIFE